MRKLAYLAAAAVGFALVATSADAQQRPMGASGSSSGSSMSSSSSSSMPAKSTAPAKKSTASKKSGNDSVKAVQTALNTKGGANVKVDGMMGKETRAALKKYQAANGLKATGQADAATKAKLGV
jgi:peptidoglycan hydrolase-like protein with peptidoglycan-binding domain